MKFSATIPSFIVILAAVAASAAPAMAQSTPPAPFVAGGGNCTSPGGKNALGKAVNPQKIIYCTLDAAYPDLEVRVLIQSCQDTAALTCDPITGPWTTLTGRPGKLRVWFRCAGQKFRTLPVVPVEGANDYNIVSLSPDSKHECYAKFYVSLPAAHKSQYGEHLAGSSKPIFSNS